MFYCPGISNANQESNLSKNKEYSFTYNIENFMNVTHIKNIFT